MNVDEFFLSEEVEPLWKTKQRLNKPESKTENKVEPLSEPLVPPEFRLGWSYVCQHNGHSHCASISCSCPCHDRLAETIAVKTPEIAHTAGTQLETKIDRRAVPMLNRITPDAGKKEVFVVNDVGEVSRMVVETK
jgi:hypothetical protein